MGGKPTDEDRHYRINRALKMVNACNRILFREKDEQRLLGEVCRVIVEIGGYHLAWIGFAQQDEEKTILPVAHCGYEDGDLTTLKITWADTERGRGPTGTAVRTGNPVICKNILPNSTFTAWRDDAIRRGYRSSIAVPLKAGDEIMGALNIYAEITDAFDDEEVELLNKLGNEIVYGTMVLRTGLEKEKSIKALHLSEEKYSKVFRASPDAITLTSLVDGRIVEINDMGLRLTGYDRDEVICRTTTELNYWADPADRERYVAMLKKDGRVTAFEADFRTKSGDIRTGLISGEIIHLQTGPHILGVIRDITERKQAEEAMITAKKETQLYLDIAEILLVALDVGGKIILINKKGCEILGDDEAQLLGKDWFDNFVPDGDREKVKGVFMRLMNGEIEPVKHFENRIQTKNGDIRIMYWHNAINKNQQGNIIGTFSSGVDITERKHAEKALRAGKEQYRELVENINDVVYSTDAAGILTYISPVIESVTGYRPEEVIGEHFITFIYKEDVEMMTAEFNELIGGVIKLSEFRIVDKFGKSIWVRTSSRPIFDKETFVGMQGILADITVQKRAEEDRKKFESKLIQAQKMESIGTLAGGIAHDFNNILSAIIGFTELAIDKAVEGEVALEDLQEVLRAGVRAKDLVKQILTFSRQSEQELRPAQVNIIAKEVLKLLRSSLPVTIEIRENIQSDSLVMADPAQIHQVLMNLCTNAGHAMQEKGGILKIDLADVRLDSEFASKHPGIKPGTFLRLTLSDTGHGMPPDIMDRIFDPFFTTKEKGEGTGLGLAVVHGIVNSLKGIITAYSDPEKGTTFNIFLPVMEREAMREKSVEKSLLTGTERILFIDDEPPLLDLGKKILESLGYKVEIRSSAVEALELFKAHPERFDLVITDMTMPKMTGEQLSEQMMAVRPDIPVILCTGFSAKMDEKKARAMGLRAFVFKPILKRDIAEAIRKVLDE